MAVGTVCPCANRQSAWTYPWLAGGFPVSSPRLRPLPPRLPCRLPCPVVEGRLYRVRSRRAAACFRWRLSFGEVVEVPNLRFLG